MAMSSSDIRPAAAVLAFLCCVALGAEQTAAYPVQRVVDGDTVVLATIGTVRLIGVDTPETVDPREPVQRFGLESAAFLRSLLDGQSVRVEYDRQRLDKYRRTLAYLALLDGTSVNLEIVRQGYGHAYLDYPFDRMDAFRAAEREAREAKRGLWADAPPAGQAALSPPTPTKVWVNTSSKVYHCPGTRYYGTTARGDYMDEADAQQKGFRSAYGRTCGPSSAAPSSAPSAVQPVLPQAGSATRPVAQTADTKVWVNTSSKVYHCPGARYYGTTARGEYMAEGDAVRQGHRPAGGKSCGPTNQSPRAETTNERAVVSDVNTTSNSDVQVWVNTSSRVYHCPGTRYYGATKNGQYMPQKAAQAAGHRPASGNICR